MQHGMEEEEETAQHLLCEYHALARLRIKDFGYDYLKPKDFKALPLSSIIRFMEMVQKALEAMEEGEDYDSDSTVLLADFVNKPQKIDAKRRRLSNLHDKSKAVNLHVDENDEPNNITDVSPGKNSDSTNWLKSINNYFARMSKNNDVNVKVNDNRGSIQCLSTKSKNNTLDKDNASDIIWIDSDDESQTSGKSQDANVNRSSGMNELTSNSEIKVSQPAAISSRRATTNIVQQSKVHSTQRLEEPRIRVLNPSAINARRSTIHFDQNNLQNQDVNENVTFALNRQINDPNVTVTNPATTSSGRASTNVFEQRVINPRRNDTQILQENDHFEIRVSKPSVTRRATVNLDRKLHSKKVELKSNLESDTATQTDKGNHEKESSTIAEYPSTAAIVSFFFNSERRNDATGKNVEVQDENTLMSTSPSNIMLQADKLCTNSEKDIHARKRLHDHEETQKLLKRVKINTSEQNSNEPLQESDASNRQNVTSIDHEGSSRTVKRYENEGHGTNETAGENIDHGRDVYNFPFERSWNRIRNSLNSIPSRFNVGPSFNNSPLNTLPTQTEETMVPVDKKETIKVQEEKVISVRPDSRIGSKNVSKEITNQPSGENNTNNPQNIQTNKGDCKNVSSDHSEIPSTVADTTINNNERSNDAKSVRDQLLDENTLSSTSLLYSHKNCANIEKIGRDDNNSDSNVLLNATNKSPDKKETCNPRDGQNEVTKSTDKLSKDEHQKSDALTINNNERSNDAKSVRDQLLYENTLSSTSRLDSHKNCANIETIGRDDNNSFSNVLLNATNKSPDKKETCNPRDGQYEVTKSTDKLSKDEHQKSDALGNKVTGITENSRDADETFAELQTSELQSNLHDRRQDDSNVVSKIDGQLETDKLNHNQQKQKHDIENNNSKKMANESTVEHETKNNDKQIIGTSDRNPATSEGQSTGLANIQDNQTTSKTHDKVHDKQRGATQVSNEQSTAESVKEQEGVERIRSASGANLMATNSGVIASSENKKLIIKFHIYFFTQIKEYILKRFPESVIALDELIQTLDCDARNGIVHTDVHYSCPNPNCKIVSNYSSSLDENKENETNNDKSRKCVFCKGMRKLHTSYLKRSLSKKNPVGDKNLIANRTPAERDNVKEPIEQCRKTQASEIPSGSSGTIRRTVNNPVSTSTVIETGSSISNKETPVEIAHSSGESKTDNHGISPKPIVDGVSSPKLNITLNPSSGKPVTNEGMQHTETLEQTKSSSSIIKKRANDGLYEAGVIMDRDKSNNGRQEKPNDEDKVRSALENNSKDRSSKPEDCSDLAGTSETTAQSITTSTASEKGHTSFEGGNKGNNTEETIGTGNVENGVVSHEVGRKADTDVESSVKNSNKSQGTSKFVYICDECQTYYYSDHATRVHRKTVHPDKWHKPLFKKIPCDQTHGTEHNIGKSDVLARERSSSSTDVDGGPSEEVIKRSKASLIESKEIRSTRDSAANRTTDDNSQRSDTSNDRKKETNIDDTIINIQSNIDIQRKEIISKLFEQIRVTRKRAINKRKNKGRMCIDTDQITVSPDVSKSKDDSTRDLSSDAETIRHRVKRSRRKITSESDDSNLSTGIKDGTSSDGKIKPGVTVEKEIASRNSDPSNNKSKGNRDLSEDEEDYDQMRKGITKLFDRAKRSRRKITSESDDSIVNTGDKDVTASDDEITPYDAVEKEDSSNSDSSNIESNYSDDTESNDESNPSEDEDDGDQSRKDKSKLIDDECRVYNRVSKSNVEAQCENYNVQLSRRRRQRRKLKHRCSRKDNRNYKKRGSSIESISGGHTSTASEEGSASENDGEDDDLSSGVEAEEEYDNTYEKRKEGNTELIDDECRVYNRVSKSNIEAQCENYDVKLSAKGKKRRMLQYRSLKKANGGGISIKDKRGGSIEKCTESDDRSIRDDESSDSSLTEENSTASEESRASVRRERNDDVNNSSIGEDVNTASDHETAEESDDSDERSKDGTTELIDDECRVYNRVSKSNLEAQCENYDVKLSRKRKIRQTLKQRDSSTENARAKHNKRRKTRNVKVGKCTQNDESSDSDRTITQDKLISTTDIGKSNNNSENNNSDLNYDNGATTASEDETCKPTKTTLNKKKIRLLKLFGDENARIGRNSDEVINDQTEFDPNNSANVQKNQESAARNNEAKILSDDETVRVSEITIKKRKQRTKTLFNDDTEIVGQPERHSNINIAEMILHEDDRIEIDQINRLLEELGPDLQNGYTDSDNRQNVDIGPENHQNDDVGPANHQNVDKGHENHQHVNMGPDNRQNDDVGPDNRQNVEIGPENHRNDDVGPENHKNVDKGHKNHQKVYIGPETHQNVDVELDNRQNVDIGPENHRNYDVGPENHQNVDKGHENHQHVNMGPDNRQNDDVVPDNRQNVEIGPENHQNDDVGPENHQNVDKGHKNYQTVNMGPENNQNVDVELDNRKNVDIGPENHRNDDVGPENHQNVDKGHKNHQKVNMGPENHQNVDVELDNRQNVDIGPENYQNVDVELDNRQNIDIGPENHRNDHVGPEIHQNVYNGHEDHQNVNTGPENHRKDDVGPEIHQNVDNDHEDHQNVNIGPENHRKDDVGPDNRQNVAIGPENHLNYDVGPDNRQNFAIDNHRNDDVSPAIRQNVEIGHEKHQNAIKGLENNQNDVVGPDNLQNDVSTEKENSDEEAVIGNNVSGVNNQSQSSKVQSCLENVQVTNVTSVANKVHIFICQTCSFATDKYDNAIRHCQNKLNHMEDPVIYCEVCQTNFDTTCFERHTVSHTKYLLVVKIKFSHHWLFSNWQAVFENNRILLGEAENMQVQSIYKTYCVKMSVKVDGPWQTALYLCAKCNTCVPYLEIEKHVSQRCTISHFMTHSCVKCNRKFSTNEMLRHHEIYHTGEDNQPFKTIVFNDRHDEKFNSKLIKLKRNNRNNNEQQRIVDIYRCLCGLCFTSLKNFKFHFLDCESHTNNGAQCPKCTEPRRFPPTELEDHLSIHRSILTYEFRTQQVAFQTESNCNIQLSNFETTNRIPQNAMQVRSNEEFISQNTYVEARQDEQTGEESLDVLKEELDIESTTQQNSVEDFDINNDTLNDESLLQDMNEDTSLENGDEVDEELGVKNTSQPIQVTPNDEDIKRDMLKDETLSQDINQENSPRNLDNTTTEQNPQIIKTINNATQIPSSDDDLIIKKKLLKEESLTQNTCQDNLNIDKSLGIDGTEQNATHIASSDDDLNIKKDMLKFESTNSHEQNLVVESENSQENVQDFLATNITERETTETTTNDVDFSIIANKEIKERITDTLADNRIDQESSQEVMIVEDSVHPIIIDDSDDDDVQVIEVNTDAQRRIGFNRDNDWLYSI